MGLGGTINVEVLAALIAAALTDSGVGGGVGGGVVVLLSADPTVTATAYPVGTLGLYGGKLYIHVTASSDTNWFEFRLDGSGKVSCQSGDLAGYLGGKLVCDSGSGMSMSQADLGGGDYQMVISNSHPLPAVTDDSQVKRSEMGQSLGVATLDGTGVVPDSQLPAGAGIPVLRLTNRGDLPTFGADLAVLPVGPIRGTVLTVDPDAPNGIEYESLPSATAVVAGIVRLGIVSGTACAGDDVRLGGRPYSGRVVSCTRNATTSARSKDGGVTWIDGAAMTNGGWYGIAWDPVYARFVAISNGATNPGGCNYSVDGGATWTTGGRLSETIQTWYRLVYDVSHGALVAVPRLQTSGAVRSVNGGASWTASVSTFPAVGFTFGCYDPTHGRVVYISETTTDSLYSDDGGVTWVAGGVTAGPMASIVFDPVHNVLIAMPLNPTGYCSYSSDGGSTWATGGALPTGGSWYGAEWDPVHGRVVAIDDTHVQTYHSNDGGLSWNAGGSLGAVFSIRKMIWNPVYALLVATAQGASSVYWSENGGETWNSAASSTVLGPGIAVAYP